MYCRMCGQPNADEAMGCTNCGHVLRTAPPQVVEVPSYLVPSILVTLACCLPLGVPAIVFAAQVGGTAAAGDVEGARTASDRAKLFCWLGFGLGLLAQIVYLLLVIAPTLWRHW